MGVPAGSLLWKENAMSKTKTTTLALSLLLVAGVGWCDKAGTLREIEEAARWLNSRPSGGSTGLTTRQPSSRTRREQQNRSLTKEYDDLQRERAARDRKIADHKRTIAKMLADFLKVKGLPPGIGREAARKGLRRSIDAYVRERDDVGIARERYQQNQAAYRSNKAAYNAGARRTTVGRH